MENKVYYGEYSLSHWIKLILTENIKLPEYQRFFVWSDDKAKTLIESFHKKQFVPPVIIGSFNINGKNENYIIDGQQRLTSLLLAYLGIFPDKNKYKKIIKQFANENDDKKADDIDNIIEWQLDDLLKKGSTKEEILEKIYNKEEYKKFILKEINNKFLDETFLGFSYIIPQSYDETIQQKFYSSVFRNINIQGEPLSPQESRESLYFLNKNMYNFFSPDFFNKFKIKNLNTYLDFIRYMALLSQYNYCQDINYVMSGYGNKSEKYYEEYIYSIVGEKQSDMFNNFENIFPNKEYDEKLKKLNDIIDNLKIPLELNSIIEADLYLFGLINEVLFFDHEINIEKKDDILNEIETFLKKYQKTDKKDLYDNEYSSHYRNPSQLSHLRTRITDSINIYKKYTKI